MASSIFSSSDDSNSSRSAIFFRPNIEVIKVHRPQVSTSKSSKSASTLRQPKLITILEKADVELESCYHAYDRNADMEFTQFRCHFCAKDGFKLSTVRPVDSVIGHLRRCNKMATMLKEEHPEQCIRTHIASLPRVIRPGESRRFVSVGTQSEKENWQVDEPEIKPTIKRERSPSPELPLKETQLADHDYLFKRAHPQAALLEIQDRVNRGENVRLVDCRKFFSYKVAPDHQLIICMLCIHKCHRVNTGIGSSGNVTRVMWQHLASRMHREKMVHFEANTWRYPFLTHPLLFEQYQELLVNPAFPAQPVQQQSVLHSGETTKKKRKKVVVVT